jgi:hypothetical protein
VVVGSVGRKKKIVGVTFAVYQKDPTRFITHKARGLRSLADVVKAPGTLAVERGMPFATWISKRRSVTSRENRSVAVWRFKVPAGRSDLHAAGLRDLRTDRRGETLALAVDALPRRGRRVRRLSNRVGRSSKTP